MIKINESLVGADLFSLRHDENYFRAENVQIKCYRDGVYITDLTNALKTGAEVVTYSITDLNPEYGVTFSSKFENFLLAKNLTLVDLVDILKAGKTPEGLKEEFRFSTITHKGIRVFSPFVKVKPVKVPTKWTITHVWKAILAGQITSGKIDMVLTDDYAYDAAVNFRTDEGIHLLSFAKDLIESPSGWWVHPDKEEGNIIQLSVNCHTFDLRTLYFDKSAATKKEVPSNLPENVAAVDFQNNGATKRQLWALHCITKKDTRNWKITRKMASDLISRANNGENIEPIINKLLC